MAETKLAVVTLSAVFDLEKPREPTVVIDVQEGKTKRI
jgi:hypothetical protein